MAAAAAEAAAAALIRVLWSGDFTAAVGGGTSANAHLAELFGAQDLECANGETTAADRRSLQQQQPRATPTDSDENDDDDDDEWR